uniref:Cyclin-dependent kinases regulatory subunit n=1 Tax=Gopherus evgoodei TaxID=1825980 RepID=A0A8C4WJD0_9SAUR
MASSQQLLYPHPRTFLLIADNACTLQFSIPKTHLMSEEEWKRLGVQQSLGWVHYMIHEPEPHILLFR